MNCDFSVIIPLYNKEAEIGRTIRSVLAQTLQPLEIIVVDDGSTDNSAHVVEGFRSPLVKLVRQQNAGETAARNRAMAEASGRWFALIDADDEWRPRFLAEAASMIEEYPDCGIYCTGFDIAGCDGISAGRTPRFRGIVENYFHEAMDKFVATASTSVIPAHVVADVGGFPEGMKLGGDQYMWTKIAIKYPVCFSPEPLAVIHTTAANRSAAIYRPEKTPYSFSDLRDTENFWLNEYIARVALGKAIVLSAKGGTEEGREAEKLYAYNRHSRRLWYRLKLLNRLPRSWRPMLHKLYTDLAWKLAKRGV